MKEKILTQQRLAAYLETKKGFLQKRESLTAPSIKLAALTLPCLVMGLDNSNKLHAATMTRVINETCNAGNNNLQINIDNAGAADIQFQIGGDGLKAGDGAAPDIFIHDNPTNWFRKIGYNANVGAGGSFNNIVNGFYAGITYNTSGCSAPWFANGPGFMIVKFYISGNLHMGWLALEVTDKQDVDGVCAGGSNQAGRQIKIIKAGWNTTSIAGGGTSINTPVTLLPAELISFSAKSAANQISLNWNTASENNNAGFEIQRSTNAKDFHTLDFIEGKGTTAEQQSYNYDDKDLRKGQLYYYRLRQIDYSGEFEYSKVITAKIENSQISGTFSPNPVANGRARLDYTTSFEGQLALRVFDVSGKELLKQSFSVSEGNNSLDVNFYTLSSGIYIVKMEQNENSSYEKIVIE